MLVVRVTVMVGAEKSKLNILLKNRSHQLPSFQNSMMKYKQWGHLEHWQTNEQLGCWKTRNGTEAEVIVVQYGCGSRTCGQKFALIIVFVYNSDLAFCNSYEDGTSTNRESRQAYNTAEVGYSLSHGSC